jgi:acetyltransferase
MYPAGIVRNLQRYGFAGRIYPVNPGRATVFDLPCYPNLSALPERPDLVVILIPRDAVPTVIDECLTLDLKAAIIITAGFREGDAEGGVLEESIRRRIAGSDLAIIGPNCAGLANLTTGMVVTRLPAPPLAGDVAFVSASGALMMALQGVFANVHLGLSRLVSVGNQLDVGLIDVLDYLAEDPDTRAIGAFVEGLEDGRRFVQAAARARQCGKPLVLVKSGRTTAGQQAAATHTAALAGSDRVFRSACRQAGVVVVDDMDDLVRTLQLFSAWAGRIPTGRRLALVTQSGGMGSLTADLATLAGFDLPDLPPNLQAQLRAMPHLLTFNDYGNPADVRGAGAVGAAVARTLTPFLEDPSFDIVILLLAKSAVEEREVETAQALAELATTARKPFCVVWVGQRHGVKDEQTEQPLRILRDAGIPVFGQSSACIASLAKVIDWQAQRPSLPRGARASLAGGAHPPAQDPVRFLSYDEIKAFFSAYDLPLMPGRLAEDADEAVAMAETLGFPVAVKGLSDRFTHKSDAGLVLLNLGDAAQVAAAVRTLARKLGDLKDVRFLVQRMALPGIEALVGVENDAQFGPVIACGPGGMLVELLDDVALGLAPLSPDDARALLDATRLGRLLRGLRGRPPADRAALANLLVRLSAMAHERQDRLVSMDLNPVIVHTEGLSIVDVRIQWRGNL